MASRTLLTFSGAFLVGFILFIVAVTLTISMLPPPLALFFGVVFGAWGAHSIYVREGSAAGWGFGLGAGSAVVVFGLAALLKFG